MPQLVESGEFTDLALLVAIKNIFCDQGAPGPVGPLGSAGPSGEKV